MKAISLKAPRKLYILKAVAQALRSETAVRVATFTAVVSTVLAYVCAILDRDAMVSVMALITVMSAMVAMRDSVTEEEGGEL